MIYLSPALLEYIQNSNIRLTKLRIIWECWQKNLLFIWLLRNLLSLHKKAHILSLLCYSLSGIGDEEGEVSPVAMFFMWTENLYGGPPMFYVGAH